MLWGLKPVSAPNASSVAVEWLRGQIHSGLLLPGEKLPPERRLAEDIAISRVTLREALKALESLEYIFVRRGVQGGAFVAEVEVLRGMATRAFARDPARAMRIHEFRGMIEPAAARFAAARREIPDLKRMSAAIEQLAGATSAAAVKQAETLFRLAVAEAAHNAYLFRALREALNEQFLPFEEIDPVVLRASAMPRLAAIFDSISSRHERSAEDTARTMIEMDWVLLRRLANPVSH